MIVEVAVLPQLLQGIEKKTCIVVDVLRASTTLVTMLEQGAESVGLAAGVEEARQLFASRPQALLCGESGGLPPKGFHYGNSPVEYSSLNLRERELIFATSNGTKAISLVSGSPHVLVGCFLNATAVVEVALASGKDIAIVCSGRAIGTSYGLDDVVCAGHMVGLIMAQVEIGNGSLPDADFAQLISSGQIETDCCYIDESAISAYRLYSSYRGDMFAAFADSGNGKGLIQLGMESDLRYCARIDASRVVPVLRRTESTLEVVKRAEDD